MTAGAHAHDSLLAVYARIVGIIEVCGSAEVVAFDTLAGADSWDAELACRIFPQNPFPYLLGQPFSALAGAVASGFRPCHGSESMDRRHANSEGVAR